MEAIEKLTGFGAQVIFAGHTHGGQVRIPFFGALTTNSDLPNRFARGLSGWEFEGKSSVLSVVAGLGNSIFAPIRFFCRPEVRLITLLAKE
jgi:predicted MPP superfamily phosphohydrolase